jgi:hypothetical protein
MVTIFRRKLGWLGVSVVVLVAGFLLAAALYALDALGVGQYSATARVVFNFNNRGEEVFPRDPERLRRRLASWRAELEETTKSRPVLTAALEQPQVAKLPSVAREQENGDPIAWLRKHLSISFPRECDVVAVTVRSRDGREAVTLANAVADALVANAGRAEPDGRRDAEETGCRRPAAGGVGCLIRPFDPSRSL